MDNKLRNLILAALFAALCCVATIVVQIPSPMDGYVNLGDCFVLMSGVLLGPIYGTAGAAIGSMLADVITGYAYYAPATFIIKGVMAIVVWAVYTALIKRTKHGVISLAIGGVLAECVMIAGYFLFACLLLGKGIAAAASIPGNAIQGVVGVVAAVALVKIVERSYGAVANRAVKS